MKLCLLRQISLNGKLAKMQLVIAVTGRLKTLFMLFEVVKISKKFGGRTQVGEIIFMIIL